MDEQNILRASLTAAFENGSGGLLRALLDKVLDNVDGAQLITLHGLAATVPGMLSPTTRKRAHGHDSKKRHRVVHVSRLSRLSRLAVDASDIVTAVLYPFLNLSEHVRLACTSHSLRSASGLPSPTSHPHAFVCGLAQACGCAIKQHGSTQETVLVCAVYVPAVC